MGFPGIGSLLPTFKGWWPRVKKATAVVLVSGAACASLCVAVASSSSTAAASMTEQERKLHGVGKRTVYKFSMQGRRLYQEDAVCVHVLPGPAPLPREGDVLSSSSSLSTLQNEEDKMEQRLVQAVHEHGVDMALATLVAGLFDGHSGEQCSSFLRDHLCRILSSHPEFHENPRLALHDAFVQADAEFVHQQEEQGLLRGGSTALVTMVRGKSLFVANTGDSRAILIRQRDVDADQVFEDDQKPVIHTRDGSKMLYAVPLSWDHKANLPKERSRIEATGGFVKYARGDYRVQGGLAMSRAIGDIKYKPHVIPDPDVFSVELTDEDVCVVMASDGLWDEMSSRDVCKIVSEELNRTRSLGRVGEQLCVESYTRGSQDNITALVIDVPALVAEFSPPKATEATHVDDNRTQESAVPVAEGTTGGSGSPVDTSAPPSRVDSPPPSFLSEAMSTSAPATVSPSRRRGPEAAA